ncbi:hypothetical protein D3C73_1152920 [compost metagenome]
MLNKVAVYGKAEHLTHKRNNHLGHTVYTASEEGICHLGDMTLFHISDSQVAQEGQNVLFKHPTSLCPLVLAVDEINPSPVLE